MELDAAALTLPISLKGSPSPWAGILLPLGSEADVFDARGGFAGGVTPAAIPSERLDGDEGLAISTIGIKDFDRRVVGVADE